MSEASVVAGPPTELAAPLLAPAAAPHDAVQAFLKELSGRCNDRLPAAEYLLRHQVQHQAVLMMQLVHVGIAQRHVQLTFVNRAHPAGVCPLLLAPLRQDRTVQSP